MNASLPPKASAKLLALGDAEREAHDLLMATTRRLSELAHALPTSSEATSANIEFEQSRLRAKLGVQQTKHAAIAQLNAQIRRWLDQVDSNVELEAVKRLKPKLEKGESPSGGIARMRAEIASLKSERVKVKLAAPTLAEMKALASAHVASLAERGKPKLTIETDKFDLRFGNSESFTARRVGVSEILAWLDPDALAKRLHADIDALPKAANAMSAKAKAERLAQISERLWTLECSEEGIVENSEEGEGPPIARRPDASPAAVLGVIRKRKAQATAA
jgi:hypothetical protein